MTNWLRQICSSCRFSAKVTQWLRQICSMCRISAKVTQWLRLCDFVPKSLASVTPYYPPKTIALPGYVSRQEGDCYVERGSIAAYPGRPRLHPLLAPSLDRVRHFFQVAAFLGQLIFNAHGHLGINGSFNDT